MNCQRLLSCLSLFCLLFVTRDILFAQWPTTVDDELFVGNGVLPKAVSDGSGGAFIAATYNSYYCSVRIQRINKVGRIVWPDPLILTGSEHQQSTYTEIISDGKGGIYLEYADTYFIEYPYKRYGYLRVQHVDSIGSQIWNNYGVTLIAPADTDEDWRGYSGEMISDGENGVIVSWLEYRNTNPRYGYGDNHIQRIDFNGHCLWDSGGVRISTKSSCSDPPQLVTDCNSGAIVFYFERSIYFQRVNQYGNKLWGERGVQGPDSAAVLNIVSNGESGIFLIFRKDVLYPKFEFWCQHIDSNGVYLWKDDGIFIGEGEYYESGVNKPILNPDQSISFTWYFKEKEYFQRITKEGVKIFAGDGISITNLDSVNVFAPVLGLNGDNYVFYKKKVSRLNYEGRHFVQRVAQDGKILFGDEGICISDTRGRELALAIWNIVPDANDGFILIFMSDPGYIFAKQVSGDGILGYVNTGIDTELIKLIPSAIQLYQNYPNPFNPITTITFSLPEASKVKTEVYDLTGRCIAVLCDRYYSAGRYSVQFDGSTLASGIYILRSQMTAIENPGKSQVFSRKMMLMK